MLALASATSDDLLFEVMNSDILRLDNVLLDADFEDHGYRGPDSGQRRGVILGQPIDSVGPTDVFCGRDRRSHAHDGNKRFRKLIARFQKQYKESRLREDKTRLTTEIVSIIRASGGRFLKENEETGKWHEVDTAYAHDKVSHALRSAKDPNRPRPKKTRKVVVAAPTPEEEEAYRILLDAQERVFDDLRKKRSAQV